MRGRLLVCMLVAVSLTGCSHSGSVSNLATDYNRAMATARNEQLLLNVLRASAREPLQFSAMGEIAATVNRSIGIDTVATNLIAGGADAISPTLKLAHSNVPVVKVTPLSSKEFTEAILRPISPDVLNLFMMQGWDAEFLLPLVVHGYSCGDGDDLILNSGKRDSAGDKVRQRLAGSAGEFELKQEKDAGGEIVLDVPQDKALEMLRSGVAVGYKIKAVGPGSSPANANVTLQGPAQAQWKARLRLCDPTREEIAKSLEGGLPQEQAEAPRISFFGISPGSESNPSATPASGAPQEKLVLRSVEGILYFLGERYRDCYLGQQGDDAACALTYPREGETRYLFLLRSGQPPVDQHAVNVNFYGRDYWVARLDRGDVDRTLKTFSFINQLIALQTDPKSVATTPTVLTVGN